MSFPFRAVYLAGAGGAGLGALAQLLHARGVQVLAWDDNASADLSALHAAGIAVDTAQGAGLAALARGGSAALVCSHALPAEHPLRIAALQLGLPVLAYPQALGLYAAGFARAVAVVGTHGKTTTTGMLARALVAAGLDPTVLVGGKVAGLQPGADGRDAPTNYRVGSSDIFVFEACEYRRSFLEYHPHMAVLTSLDYDHPDTYPTRSEYDAAFSQFAAQVGGTVVAHHTDAERLQLAAHQQLLCVGADGCDYSLDRGAHVLHTPAGPLAVAVGVPGEHNRRNAALVLAAAMALGAPMPAVLGSLQQYGGSWRRLERLGSWRGHSVIDDYGHHPSEIRATLQALREEQPHGHIALIFQPHQLTRLRSYLDDFAAALALADSVTIAPIYSVRDGAVTPAELLAAQQQLAAAVQALGTAAVAAPTLQSALPLAADAAPAAALLLCMGAGDISDTVRAAVAADADTSDDA